MFRPAVRRVTVQSASRSVSRSVPSQRFLSTAPPHKQSRSWKNSAVRWGLAGTLIYYYNTTNVFAEEPSVVVRHSPPETSIESEFLPTLDSVTAQRQAQAKAEAEAEARKQAAAAQEASAAVDAQVPGADEAAPGSPEQLEEEAGQQGAFNEETGEINWECPCLGGMAHGPCGPEFREAFSCFVFSKEEPKGMECIDKFKNMQNCFREHPDVYGAELDDEESEARQGQPEGQDQIEGQDQAAKSTISSEPSHGEKVAHSEPDHPEAVQGKRERSVAATEQVKKDHDVLSETDEIVPKAWHDSK